MEHYSAMKKNKPLINAVTWINCKNIMLSERDQTEKEYTVYDSVYAKFKFRQNEPKMIEIRHCVFGGRMD